ncbi:MAG: cadmium-translocating P-type ATPase [Acidobacteria bacterium]|nr:MAG: cadmium-translocating P-type ATPase [Acidobacteriota bacterium]
MEPRRSCRHCALPVPAGRLRDPFCCFGCRLAFELARPAAAGDAPPSTLLLRLGLGIFLALNVMVASWPFYAREIFGDGARPEGAYAAFYGLFAHLAFFLTTLVLVLLGVPLLRDALRPLLAPGPAAGRLAGGRLNAQLLIVIGVFSAYVLSAVHTWRGAGSLYYDTAAMVLVIVTLGSYLEAGARRRAASSARHLLAELPAAVTVARDGAFVRRPVTAVRPGDLLRLRPGQTVPVDGRVEEGESLVDEAGLTGEATPRAAAPGDRLLAGTTAVDGQLLLRAERTGDDTVLALVERSLAAARARQPPIQRLADRAAAIFVPAVVLLAVVLAAVKTAAGDLEGGVLRALAVLLISCPCALGLAAPLASWHALRRAARLGILIDGPETLERAAAVDRLWLDKTGTLSEPRPALAAVATAPAVRRRRALAWAAGLESASDHPIARAVLAEARRAGLETPLPEAARTVPGLGIEGRFDGRLLRLGSARWVERLGVEGLGGSAGDGGDVFLFDRRRVLARFAVEERLRPQAAAAIAELQRMGIEVAVLSGDRQAAVDRLAARLGIAGEGDLLPDDKVRRLAAARSGGGRLAMAGDGINDAPVLAAADVGIALGSASDLARRSGNVRLLSDRLDRLPLLFALARDARRRIRANLLWAFAFNSGGIALAAAGRLTPVVAALLMVLSSLLVGWSSSGAGRRLTGSAAADERRRRTQPRPSPLLAGDLAEARGARG